jgi:class 3 adenylate cyclase
MFKHLKLPSVQPADITYETPEGHLQLSYDSINYSDAWIEEPYEWEYPYRMGVKRSYKNGPYKELTFQVDLYPNTKGTRLQYQLWIVPGNALLSFLGTLKQKTLVRGRLKKYYKLCDEISGASSLPYQFEMKKRLQTGAQKRIANIVSKLYRKTDHPAIVDKLIGFIERAEDIDLIQIKPLELAKQWNVPSNQVIRVFLYAVKDGLLNFNWNLVCPDCRSIQQTCKTLSEIHEPIYCYDCHKEFYVNFNRTVHLCFKPNPLVRKLSGKQYALAGPHKRRHTVIQQYLKPRQSRYVKTKLPKGRYLLTTSNSKGKIELLVGDDGNDTVRIRLNELGLEGKTEIITQPNLILENGTQKEQLFTIETTEWKDHNLTAAHVTSLQVFRDLFSNEVLRKGEKIAVDQLTLMFTDLFNSTGMYDKEGDNQAVGRVIEHFDILQQAVASQDGAIVKTIGDSVMAVFSNPAQAFRAFVNAQKTISRDKRFDKTLKLKAGIHHGSCVAVNLSNKIDYFGSTVNIASRLVDFADANEVVISDSVTANGEMSEILREPNFNYPSEKKHVQLKGFDNRHFAIHHIRMEHSSLRLVI